MHPLLWPVPADVPFPDGKTFALLQAQLAARRLLLRRVHVGRGLEAFTVIDRRAMRLIATLPEVRHFARNIGAA
jgi:hypothetical protein